MNINNYPEISEFINNKVKLEVIFDLPHFYPKKEKFDEFQYGYRYNPISKKSLIGTNEGNWEKEWFVICSSYYNDPFIINISEKKLNFPVYYAPHGTGKWSLEKITNSIQEFENLLVEIKPIEENYSQAIEFIKKQNPNSFWNQIIEELIEAEKYKDGEE